MSEYRSAVVQMPGMGALVAGADPYNTAAMANYVSSLQTQMQLQSQQISAQGQQLQKLAQLAQQAQQKPQAPRAVRTPVFPTAPYLPTSGNIGTQTRFYGATLTANDPDYTVGQEAIRIVNFDIPCYLIAMNGGAFVTAAPNAFPLGVQANATYLFRIEYSTGDKLMTGPRLATTCIGDGFNPGEVGGTGYVIQPGASVQLGITPLLASLRIDISLHCVEVRAPSNYTVGQ
jgi:hypothetical protein